MERRLHASKPGLRHLVYCEGLGVNLSINTGITDGHNGSVPVSQTLHAFNEVAAVADRVSEATILEMVKAPEMPTMLLQKIDDALYQRKPALLEQQRKGKPPVWDIREVPNVDLTKLDTKSGK